MSFELIDAKKVDVPVQTACAVLGCRFRSKAATDYGRRRTPQW
jgi:hypothetical protein